MSSAGRVPWTARTALALLVRPALWPVAAAQVVRLAAPGWWRRRPFLPLPGAEYLRFRIETAYGSTDRSPDPADVLAYLRWCDQWPSAHRGERLGWLKRLGR